MHGCRDICTPKEQRNHSPTKEVAIDAIDAIEFKNRRCLKSSISPFLIRKYVNNV